jgi:hypothetical protein
MKLDVGRSRYSACAQKTRMYTVKSVMNIEYISTYVICCISSDVTSSVSTESTIPSAYVPAVIRHLDLLSECNTMQPTGNKPDSRAERKAEELPHEALLPTCFRLFAV